MMTGNIKDDILNYFNDKSSYGTGTLKVLDNKYRMFYTGVSLQYIVYDLLKAKYRKSDVCQVLYDLIDDDTIQAIHCPTVKKIVFETLKSGHYPYVFTTKVKVLEYLKEFIR